MTSGTPMGCGEVVNRLDDYVDRELSQEEMAQVEAHLAQCADCAEQHEFEEGVLRCLKEKLQRIAIPDDVAARILGAVARGEAPTSPLE